MAGIYHQIYEEDPTSSHHNDDDDDGTIIPLPLAPPAVVAGGGILNVPELPSWRLSTIQGDIQAFTKLLDDDPHLLNAHDGLGVTPLIRAAAWGHREMVDYLVNQGADLNLTDTTGASALFLACSNGR
jgi:Ankyrin repeats (many copies)